MEHSKETIAGISCGATLLIAGVASADPIAIITTPEHLNGLVGSDTLNQVMDITLASLPLTQITEYNGLGSVCGERQMAGSPNAGEPFCLPNDANGGAEGNPGCQEIAAMSRQMQLNICEDDADDPRDPNDSTTVNDTAEDLAVCRDALSVITDNAAHRMFGADQAACDAAAAAATSSNPPINNAAYAGTGKLRASGTLPSGYVISDWKDVLRLIYTGCRNDQGTCSSVARLTRCSPDTNSVRAELINNWALMVESGAVAGDTQIDCNGAGANTCTELRKAYRRDDFSGTTGVFLELLGVALNVANNLTGRVRWTPALGQPQDAPQPIPSTHSFCDGGMHEGFVYHQDLTTRGDPITKPCRPEDDICGANGQMGVVRAIRSSQPGGFPPVQCTRGRFALKQFLNTSLPLCPDGSKPSAGQCKLPYYAVDRNGDDDNTDPGDRDFNCLNDMNSRPSSVPLSTDGRAYNFVWRDSDGNVLFVTAGLLPETASWRENQGVLDTTLPVPGGPFPQTCVEEDSTRQQGCLVGNTQCTIAFAGRPLADQDPFDALGEPFLVNGAEVSDTNIGNGAYPLIRSLYISAIGGFENITVDCQARGGSAGYCADQITIAREFYDMGPVARNACLTGGFIPMPDPICVGSQAAAGCGAPTLQPKEACFPQ